MSRLQLIGVCLSVRRTLKCFDTCGMFFICLAFEQFKEAINDEDFEDLLKDAQADPKGVAAQDFPKKAGAVGQR